MTRSAELRSLAHPTTPSIARSDTDAELVAGCLARNPVAEQALYERHVDALYRVAFRLCGDADTAADITQEAFVQAFSRLGQFRGGSALRTWLIAIVVTSAGMMMRKGRWLRSRTIDLDDRIPTPSARPAEADLTAQLDAGVAALPDKLRVVLVMYDIEGFTHAEIGAALGIPAGTSKARLSGARAKLRVALAHHWSDRLL